MELEIIRSKIYDLRGLKVMLDSDLAALYQVETKVLNQGVKRNLKRFPLDFMFQLTKNEWEILKSQIVTSRWGGSRKLPYVFTEQGLAMLSGILKSDIAISVNIQIMRAFVEMRKFIESSKNDALKVTGPYERMKSLEDALYELSEDNQKEFDDIYLALSELAQKQKSIGRPRRAIGYNVKGDI